MKLYVLRHGQTNLNARNLICGRTDDALAADGEKQAEAAGIRLASLQAEQAVDAMFVSPLSRAQKTAEIVHEAIRQKQNISVPFITEPRLIEQAYGAFEKTDRLSQAFAESKMQFAQTSGGMESILHVAWRVYSLIEELRMQEPREYRNVLFVTHGGVCRVIRSYFCGMTNTEFAHWRAENCQIDEYELL
ncbi:MAG: histidine phosphatase family protein [Bacteroides sp.]|nr:histidine phosphatase family protein [Prevotella sp.]MCM1406862.1 histidine phosphatase family protein [Treponema brennaborense]MCM1470809.1 histidine phosphatase family protein [Bacteroides sp.]